MDKLKLSSFVLFVNDVAISKKFYEELLDQEVTMDIGGINVGFKSGLALWQKQYAQKIIFEKEFNADKSQNNLEVYFETSNLDEIFQKVQKSDSKIVHDIKTQPWQQRVFRLYDPDNFIIEIAETMEEVIKRLNGSGMSLELIMEKTFMPKEIIESIIK
jgi:predicted enzyme related to lactoylglutathione lyase